MDDSDLRLALLACVVAIIGLYLLARSLLKGWGGTLEALADAYGALANGEAQGRVARCEADDVLVLSFPEGMRQEEASALRDQVSAALAEGADTARVLVLSGAEAMVVVSGRPALRVDVRSDVDPERVEQAVEDAMRKVERTRRERR